MIVEKELERIKKLFEAKNIEYNTYDSHYFGREVVEIEFIPKKIKELYIKHNIPYESVKSSIFYEKHRPLYFGFDIVYTGEPYIAVSVPPAGIKVTDVIYDEDEKLLKIKGFAFKPSTLSELIFQIPSTPNKKFEEKLEKAGL